MIKVENVDVYGFEHAIRAMRHPMLSYNKIDSKHCLDFKDCNECKYNDEDPEVCNDPYYDFLDGYIVGDNDLDLMQRLYRSGTEHRTYARMIMVWMDITAPLYWWKEMDRYTVGKSQVSCSTMHKIMAKPFELDDFSHDNLSNLTGEYYDEGEKWWNDTINVLNNWRERYLTAKKIDEIVDGDNDIIMPSAETVWRQVIEMLMSSYNQKRTVCMSYEVVFKIIKERTGHKLTEWDDFITVLKGLPHVKEIMESK